MSSALKITFLKIICSVRSKFTSHSDPASQWTAARKGPAFFAYSANYMIDTDHAVILDVEASRSVRQAELGAMQTMLDRTKDTFDINPERMIADTAYGTGPLLDWLVQKRGIAPHIPVVDKSGRTDGTFERADFTYDVDNDAYICPGGKELKQSRRAFTTPRTTKPDKDGILRYRARKADCDACQLVGSTGGRNTLIFDQRWSVGHEVSSPYLLFSRSAGRDLGSLAARGVNELDWAGV